MFTVRKQPQFKTIFTKSQRLLILWLCSLALLLQTPNTAHADFTYPEYQQQKVVTLNNNKPTFTQYELRNQFFESYSKLDKLGRCGPAFACLDKAHMPTGKRGSIGKVKPSGWKLVKYDCIKGMYLFNRCHLIGWQFTGQNKNRRNLITGTRYLNTKGMLPYENDVADYIERTNNHVMYRVTPAFKGDELVARGVQIEAYSVEDLGKGISFNIYCHNVQPYININYQNGESSLASDAPQTNQAPAASQAPATTQAQSPAPAPTQAPQAQSTYILNANTRKFHYSHCRCVKRMKDSNKIPLTGTRDQAISQGYDPCQVCNP